MDERIDEPIIANIRVCGAQHHSATGSDWPA